MRLHEYMLYYYLYLRINNSMCNLRASLRPRNTEIILVMRICCECVPGAISPSSLFRFSSCLPKHFFSVSRRFPFPFRLGKSQQDFCGAEASVAGRPLLSNNNKNIICIYGSKSESKVLHLCPNDIRCLILGV